MIGITAVFFVNHAKMIYFYTENGETTVSVTNRNLHFKFKKHQLQTDYEVVKRAIKIDCNIFHHVSDQFKANYDLVRIAVSQSGLMIKELPLEYRQDRDIVLLAVSSNGLALEFVDKKFRSDEEIIMEAIKNNFAAMVFVECEIGYEFMMKLVGIDPSVFWFMKEKWKDNYKVIKEVISIRGCLIALASHRLQMTPEIVMCAVRYGRCRLKSVKVEKLYDIMKSNHLLEYYEILYEGCPCEVEELPKHLQKLPDHGEWLRIQINVLKGNGLTTYHNNYDIEICYLKTFF